jgi:hypothetical protein
MQREIARLNSKDKLQDTAVPVHTGAQVGLAVEKNQAGVIYANEDESGLRARLAFVWRRFYDFGRGANG